MKSLIKYLKDYKRESILGPLFKLLEASFELLVPLVMAKLIDQGIKNQDLTYIWKMGGILVLLGVVGLVCSITAQYFAAKAAVGFGTGLRNDLLKHINQFSYTELDQIGTSTLITRMTSDVNQLQSGINLVLRLFLRSPFIVFGAMAMAFTIDVKAALIFVVTIPLLSIVVFGIMVISMPLYKKVQRQLDQVLLTTRENLIGVRVIRAFNQQKREVERFERDNYLLVQAQVFVGKISALMNPVTYLIINGAIIVLIYTGAVQVEGGIITQGAVVALINYMSQILVELIKLANLIITISKSFASGSRVEAVFRQKSSMPDENQQNIEIDASDHDHYLEFTDVSFVYPSSQEESLSGLSVQIKKGETIGIIGGTGSGKTTFVNLLPRFYDITAGSVRLNGVKLEDYPVKQLRDLIGIVPQRSVLFQGSIRENIRWGKETADDQEIWRALEIAQASAFVSEKEGGLDFEVNQGGKNLSGGQRQRLTIARALVMNPEILIMDDSSSALDFATDARLRKAIREDTKQMTVFLISQRVSTIKGADKIIVLDDGKMVGCGTHQELLESCKVYQEICLSQLSKEEVAAS